MRWETEFADNPSSLTAQNRRWAGRARSQKVGETAGPESPSDPVLFQDTEITQVRRLRNLVRVARDR